MAQEKKNISIKSNENHKNNISTYGTCPRHIQLTQVGSYGPSQAMRYLSRDSSRILLMGNSRSLLTDTSSDSCTRLSDPVVVDSWVLIVFLDLRDDETICAVVEVVGFLVLPIMHEWE